MQIIRLERVASAAPLSRAVPERPGRFSAVFSGVNCFRLWKAHRAVEFALVPGADVASLGAADAVLHRVFADLADFNFIAIHL